MTHPSLLTTVEPTLACQESVSYSFKEHPMLAQSSEALQTFMAEQQQLLKFMGIDSIQQRTMAEVKPWIMQWLPLVLDIGLFVLCSTNNGELVSVTNNGGRKTLRQY